jgi:hypothetical protein
VALAEPVPGEGKVVPANLPTKYYAQRLFEYSLASIDRCAVRLVEQAEIYRTSDEHRRDQMATRGLFAAALTLASTAVCTAKMLERGKFWMETQVLFFRNRWRNSPDQWGPSAKSCLARSWSGFSIGADAVCIDRHLERLQVHPPDAVAQWKVWFDLYDKMYGPGETELCVRWHVQILDWIAFRADRPRSWK